MDLRSLLLTTAYRHRINEANIEAGYQQFCSLIGQPIDYAAFCDTVSALQRDQLIYEPIRLPEGSLQCHWHLELTPAGAHAARVLLQSSSRDENTVGE